MTPQNLVAEADVAVQRQARQDLPEVHTGDDDEVCRKVPPPLTAG